MATNVIRAGQACDLLPIKFEKLAAAPMSPGHLLLTNTSGKFKKHDSAGAGGLLFIADTKPFKGVSDAYTTDELVYSVQPNLTDLYWVRAATGQALVEDVTPLASDGSGRVVVATGTNKVLCYAAATVTTAANEELVLVRFAASAAAA